MQLLFSVSSLDTKGLRDGNLFVELDPTFYSAVGTC